MPFNGSGTYIMTSLPGSFNPAATGSNATPADWNTALADLSTALSTCITKDGQTTVTADIPMATHKITGLGNATAQTDALNQQSALYLIDQQDATAVGFIDFVNIAATVNNLVCIFELRPGTNAVDLILQTYGADGVLDTGGTDYSDIGSEAFTTAGAPTSFGTNGASSIRLNGNITIGNTTDAFICDLTAANIQAATKTKFFYRSGYFNGAATDFVSSTAMGLRNEADRITGFRVTVSSGVFTGKFTLFGSV